MSESDEFDKEAEREKLREKLERDEQKRQHTQHMSELLLKGATMTNRHCEDCGDPIFSHNGQEFCPTCSQSGGNAGNVTAGNQPETTEHQQRQSGQEYQDTGTAELTGQNDTDESRQTSVRTQRSTGGEVEPEADASGGTAERAAARDPQLESETVSNQSDPDQETRPRGQPRDGIDSGVTAPGVEPGNPQAGSVDLTEARKSLAQTVTKFARAAENAENPRRAQEYLKAAREAAEALEPLR